VTFAALPVLSTALTLPPLSVLSTVLVDVALIMVVSKLLGRLMAQVGQPPVIGEILGGIALGPSLLGALIPASQSLLFPALVLEQLNLLAQLGLILFMFLIGLEVQPEQLRGRVPLASRVSLVGVVLPLLLGILLGLALEQVAPELLPHQNVVTGSLFMGTAMAITAFPVLARILKERGLLAIPLGQLVITCAATDDILGWLLLAGVISFSHSGSLAGAWPALLFTGLWALVLLVGLRPMMAQLERHYRSKRELDPAMLALVLAGAILSAIVTEMTGVHYIFGAFLFGLALPRYGPLQRRLQLQTEQLVVTLLLPIFFAISGLRTSLSVLQGPTMLLALGAVLVVAIGGKYLGCWGVARLAGLPAREAQAVGWLMNTRGLTELVVLNVGLSLGVIGPALFTVMVMMALITTAMAGPLLGRLGYGRIDANSPQTTLPPATI
jgi:Kef-type K+ transport system membrane component KefB